MSLCLNKQSHAHAKKLYRVKNWTDYDKALVQRGSLTFWLSNDFEKNWLYSGEKQRGGQFDYSEKAIEIILTIKEVFHLTNRQTEGFLRSLFAMLKIALPVPDHSTLSKRGNKVRVSLPKRPNQRLHIVMDSTGLKIYGEGEWKVCDNTAFRSDARGANYMWAPIQKTAKFRPCF